MNYHLIDTILLGLIVILLAAGLVIGVIYFILSAPESEPQFSSLTIFASPNLNYIKLKNGIMDFSSSDHAKSVDAVWGTPTDDKGNDAPIEKDSVKHVSDNEDVATVEKDPDNTGNELAHRVKFTGKTGAFSITTTADAKIGEGVEEIKGQWTGEITSSQATAFGKIKVGDPVVE